MEQQHFGDDYRKLESFYIQKCVSHQTSVCYLIVEMKKKKKVSFDAFLIQQTLGYCDLYQEGLPDLAGGL